MAFNKTERPEGAKMRRPGGMRRRKKVCVFCGDKNGVIDYKDCLLYTSASGNCICRVCEIPRTAGYGAVYFPLHGRIPSVCGI